jgi:hypothetical protein
MFASANQARGSFIDEGLIFFTLQWVHEEFEKIRGHSPACTSVLVHCGGKPNLNEELVCRN